MTARDELANVIAETYLNNMAAGPLAPKLTNTDLAEDILAAGYTRPRTVTTIEELDALPLEAPDLPWWSKPGDPRMYGSRHLALPVTVLWEPQP